MLPPLVWASGCLAFQSWENHQTSPSEGQLTGKQASSRQASAQGHLCFVAELEKSQVFPLLP